MKFKQELDKNYEHNNVLVCPNCNKKVNLLKREISLNVEMSEEVEISNKEHAASWLVGCYLDYTAKCPDCGFDMHTLDGDLYDIYCEFNRKGYYTAYSCIDKPYICFDFDVDIIDNLIKSLVFMGHDESKIYFKRPTPDQESPAVIVTFGAIDLLLNTRIEKFEDGRTAIYINNTDKKRALQILYWIATSLPNLVDEY